MRNFKKVSKVKEAFIPQRKTKKSAGYDFFAPWGGVTLNPGQSILFKTGIKCQMNDNEVLYIHIRSSLGIKYNLQLTNGTGIIDADYYNNPDNEGEILIDITNRGNAPYTFRKGDRIAQGIFHRYHTVDTEDVDNLPERVGGVGSTGK
jgi:dUTP pyrophosphatase